MNPSTRTMYGKLLVGLNLGCFGSTALPYYKPSLLRGNQRIVCIITTGFQRYPSGSSTCCGVWAVGFKPQHPNHPPPHPFPSIYLIIYICVCVCVCVCVHACIITIITIICWMWLNASLHPLVPGSKGKPKMMLQFLWKNECSYNASSPSQQSYAGCGSMHPFTH